MGVFDNVYNNPQPVIVEGTSGCGKHGSFLKSVEEETYDNKEITIGVNEMLVAKEVAKIVARSIDKEKLVTEIKKQLVKELKSEIYYSDEVSNAIKVEITKVNEQVSNRVNKAISKKLEEVEKIDILKSFDLKIVAKNQ